MDYQLLVVWQVVEHLSVVPARERRQLRDCLRRIGQEPNRMSDYQEADAVGRTVEIHICCGHAFKYWIDHADQQIKVLDMYSADRPRS